MGQITIDLTLVDWPTVLVTAIFSIIIALVVGYFLLRSEYLSGRFVAKKELTYEVLSQSVLVDEESTRAFDGDLQILWKGQPANNFIVVPVIIASTGRKPIIASDFSMPLRIKIDGSLLGAKVSHVEPPGLGDLVKYETTANQFELEPIPLNHTNYLVVTLLLSTFNSLEVSGHIAGTEIRRLVRTDRRELLETVSVGVLKAVPFVGPTVYELYALFAEKDQTGDENASFRK